MSKLFLSSIARFDLCFQQIQIQHRNLASGVISSLVAYSMGLSHCFFGIPLMSGLAAILFLNADIFVSFLNKLINRYQSARANKFSAFMVSILLFGIATIFLYFSWQSPAYAFLVDAETWLKGAFGVESGIISLVFNLLRAILIIYLVIALISVIQKMQQGDDWQTLARIPFIVLVVVFGGDLLIGTIIGGSGSTSEG